MTVAVPDAPTEHTEHRTRYLARAAALHAVATDLIATDARSLWFALAAAAASIAQRGRPDNPLLRREVTP